MDANRRAGARKDAFRIGAIVIDGASAEIDCLVWNQSATGAQIELEAPDSAPDAFTLLMTSYARPRRCEVVWRRGRKLGVAFVAVSAALDRLAEAERKP